MFDYPTEDLYMYLGVSLVSVAALATVLALPTVPPPDAAGAAATVDRVAASDPPTSGTHPLPSGDVRLTPRSLALRTDSGTARARFAFGPVVPVGDDLSLARVLSGSPPSAAFDSPAAFAAAASRARTAARADESAPGFRPTHGELRVRHVSWGGVDVTLVGA